MTPVTSTRHYGRLTAPDINRHLTPRSVLCLPIGAHEQHGPHLPLNTDTVIAEQFTNQLVDRYGQPHDLWALPPVPYGLSLEHAWSLGTISLRITSFTILLDALIGEYVRATPARHLLIVNGHGGNRGILEPALYELQRQHGVTTCVIHPTSLSTTEVDSEVLEIHAGIRETSMMLALAPDDVHLDRLPADYNPGAPDPKAVQRLVRERGTTWPWSSGDHAIATRGITGGDPQAATAVLGRTIIDSALDAAADVLDHLTTHRPQQRLEG